MIGKVIVKMDPSGYDPKLGKKIKDPTLEKDYKKPKLIKETKTK